MAGGAPPVAVLEAVAGVRLPETLAITAAPNLPANTLVLLQADSFSLLKMRSSLFECRTYRAVAPTLASQLAVLFRRAGIRPVLHGEAGADLTYLIPFESLLARDRAWTALNADPQWTAARRPFQSYQFGLYRVV
jgi:hypothetical protein